MASQRPVFDPEQMRTAGAVPAERTMSVSQLTATIKRILGDQLPTTIHLIGEISNLTCPTSGHLYLTLKDERSEIRAAMWRSSAEHLKFQPEDGVEVIATGHVDVYEPRGQYQFIIRKLEPRGTGTLELAFRRLREQLQKEGLFEQRHKKPIPRYPRQIGLVTSPTGAAVRDILRTLHRRFPCVGILLYPVRVQGEGAALEIANAIAYLNREATSFGGIDTIIVARGGGSLEELWAFNEEVVARAIHASTIPIISGVGHEVDVTIADLVADLRAATPTAAAEQAVPVLNEELDKLARIESRVNRAVRHRLDLMHSRIVGIEHSSFLRDPTAIIRRADQQLDEAIARLRLCALQRIRRYRDHLHAHEVAVTACQPAILLQYHRRRLVDTGQRLSRTVAQQIDTCRRAIGEYDRTMRTLSSSRRITIEHERLRHKVHRLGRALVHDLKAIRDKMDSLAVRLDAVSYRNTLIRGFTITRIRETRELITSPERVRSGMAITTETADGTFNSQVTDHK